MLVYIFLLILSLLTLTKNKSKRVFYCLLLIYMLLIAGFRYEVGTDYWRYELAYTEDFFWFPEVGLKIIVNLLKDLNISVQGYFFILALFIQMLIIKSIKKYSPGEEVFYLALFFFISLYYFNHSMNLIRQFIALGVFMLNIENIIHRRFFKYNIYFGLMFLIHQSSVLLYPFYFIPFIFLKIINNRISRNIILFISFVLMFVKFDTFIIDILAEYGRYYSYYAVWGAENYLDYDLSWQMALVMIAKLVLSFWIINNKEKFVNNRQHEVLFCIYFIGVILTFPLYPMLIFRRLLYPINIVEIIVYSLFIQQRQDRLALTKIIFIVYSIIFYFAHLLSGFSSPLPYDIRLFW